jgi:hypothetical protein
MFGTHALDMFSLLPDPSCGPSAGRLATAHNRCWFQAVHVFGLIWPVYVARGSVNPCVCTHVHKLLHMKRQVVSSEFDAHGGHAVPCIQAQGSCCFLSRPAELPLLSGSGLVFGQTL